jgi:cytochrome c551/c552
MLIEPVKSQALSAVQKAQLTYHAVCSGCHAYDHTMIGPPMIVVKAIYHDNPEGLAKWIANPTKKRPLEQFPAMPPQNYLSEELRLNLARYILNEVGAQ